MKDLELERLEILEASAASGSGGGSLFGILLGIAVVGFIIYALVEPLGHY